MYHNPSPNPSPNPNPNSNPKTLMIWKVTAQEREAIKQEHIQGKQEQDKMLRAIQLQQVSLCTFS